MLQQLKQWASRQWGRVEPTESNEPKQNQEPTPQQLAEMEAEHARWEAEGGDQRDANDYNPAWEGGPSNPTPEQRLDHAADGLLEQQYRLHNDIEYGRQEFREGQGETPDQMSDRHNDEHFDMATGSGNSYSTTEMPSQQTLRHRVEEKDRDWLEKTQDEPNPIPEPTSGFHNFEPVSELEEEHAP